MNYMQQPMQNLKDISDPTTAIDMTLALMAKVFTLNNTTLTNNNQRSSSNPSNMQIAQPDMNMNQDRQMLMVKDNVGNQFRPNVVQNVENQVVQNAVQNLGIQIVENINGLSVVSEIANEYGNINVVKAPAEGNDAYEETERVKASTSGTQSDKAPVYNSDGLAEVSSVEQGVRTAKEHPANVEETRALYDSLCNNLAIEVEKFNTVNRKLRETNTDLTTELARYKNQENCFEISQEKYDKLERLQNFEIQFLKEAAKFVRDFKSLSKEADEYLAKHKALELEIGRLLRAIVSQDIMSIVQSNYVVDTFNLQTELDQCKYDKIAYDKAYNDMQQKIERLQAQLGDQKGKSKDTSCVSNTLDPLPQKLENENVVLEFQLRAQLFDKVSEQKDTTKDASVNTLFCKQSILGKPPFSGSKLYHITPFPKSSVLPKVDKTNALSKPVTSNSAPSTRESKDVKNNNRTRRPLPRNNPKNDKVPSKSKSCRLLNNLEKTEENHRNLQSSSNKKHMSSECNNIKLAIRNAKSEVVFAMCKKCLITINHDVCVLNYVNGMNSRGKKQKANVSNIANQMKHAQVWKPKNVGSKEILASPKPSTPRSCLRWSPTGRLFDLKEKIIASSESESQSKCSNGYNACTSNPQEPISKRFPNSTFSMTGGQNWFDTLLILLLSEYKPMDNEDHRHNECGT
nr:hypothetical protein [Tanacetum cinerariifolium]